VIKHLKDNKTSFDSFLNGVKVNDFINEPIDHQKLFSNSDNVIHLLQANSFNEENCTMLEKSRMK
jgi:hypothetical protein